MLAPLLALLSLAHVSHGLVDVTTQLYGRTIYAMYKYTGFSNRWIGPFAESDPIYVEYDGYLRYVDEVSIFDPDNKVRLHVMNCGGGFACIRTRWRDDSSTPRTAYLQADWKDVDFEFSSSPTTDDQVRWQILCEDLSYQTCYFGSIYYPDSAGYARIYGGNSYTLDTDWVTDNPASWYQFKLVVPKAASLGHSRREQTACNTGSAPLVVSLTYRYGVSHNNTGFGWATTDSIADEVKSGFAAAIQTNSILDLSEWQKEINLSNTGFAVPVSKTVEVTISPRSRTYVDQLIGTYGPYMVSSSQIQLRSESCTST